MDRETKATLNRISAKIPSRLTRDLNRKEYNTEQEDKALLALKSPHISLEKKRRLQALLDRGAFRTSKEVVNEQAIAELDKFHSREIAKAKAAGRLKDPMTDPFFAKRVKRQQRIAMGLDTPVKQKPYTQQEVAHAREQLDPTINPQNHAPKNRKAK